VRLGCDVLITKYLFLFSGFFAYFATIKQIPYSFVDDMS
jgi:hypothetical protein